MVYKRTQRPPLILGILHRRFQIAALFGVQGIYPAKILLQNGAYEVLAVFFPKFIVQVGALLLQSKQLVAVLETDSGLAGLDRGTLGMASRHLRFMCAQHPKCVTLATRL